VENESGDENAGDHVVAIRVSEAGIAAELLAKVCDPSFFTKGLNGTCLGLSKVYGFTRQSGGDLHVTSEHDKATCVALRLPDENIMKINGVRRCLGLLARRTNKAIRLCAR
jgi:C4-dicarboxylate-specific signal transduction histidine kinase